MPIACPRYAMRCDAMLCLKENISLTAIDLGKSSLDAAGPAGLCEVLKLATCTVRTLTRPAKGRLPDMDPTLSEAPS